eukprot:2284709-Rhodomonas_salina.10
MPQVCLLLRTQCAICWQQSPYLRVNLTFVAVPAALAAQEHWRPVVLVVQFCPAVLVSQDGSAKGTHAVPCDSMQLRNGTDFSRAERTRHASAAKEHAQPYGSRESLYGESALRGTEVARGVAPA